MPVSTPAELEIRSHSPEETFAFGRRFGDLLFPGAVLALIGDLGSGKTFFTKALSCGLGVKEYRRVTSPTFVIKQEYVGRLRIHHYDAYRLATADELLALGFDEVLGSGGVVVIEWADRVREAMPTSALTVLFEHLPSNRGTAPSCEPVISQNRLITLTGKSQVWDSILRQLG